MSFAYPILLDVSDRQIVIVGGGEVAARKAVALLAAGAVRIRAVALNFKALFPDGVDCRVKAYEPADLKDADLIFAATDSIIVNDAVVRDAREARILINRVDSVTALPGDFVTPAKFKAGPITVTVSAQSAALTAMIRNEMLSTFNPEWIAMAEAMQTLRPMIKSNETNGSDRSEIFRKLATPEAMRILRENGIEGLKNWITRDDPSTV